MLNQTHMLRRLGTAAADGADDFLGRTTADGLFTRMQPMALTPSLIVDLGCGHGHASQRLSKDFRRARVLSIDLSAPMLQNSRAGRGLFSRQREVRADALQLPLPTASVDVVFANLLLPWLDDLPGCFREAGRVLRRDGLFMFSTLGPDSLQELRDAWAQVDSGEHVRRFPDMQNLGDAIMASGIADPVLDVDTLTITYQSVDKLLADVGALGARNSIGDRRPTITGKNRLQAFREQLAGQRSDGVIRVTLELIYGHAWGRGDTPGEHRIGAADIGRRRRV